MCLLMDNGAGAYIGYKDQLLVIESFQTVRTQLNDNGEMSVALHAGVWGSSNLPLAETYYSTSQASGIGP